jgi:5-methylcytosine-specific restriction endonuclease McrA
VSGKLDRSPRRSDCTWPPDGELVALMAAEGSVNAVARRCGRSREALRDFLRIRSALDCTMRAYARPPLTDDQRLENNRRSGREYARRFRAEQPERARRDRREHMRTYGPEYRHRWNHYNRLRRLGVALPDPEADEYALVLRRDPCSYCGGSSEHIDHIVPIARGGDGRWDNLTAACANCNFSKSAKPLPGFLAVDAHARSS